MAKLIPLWRGSLLPFGREAAAKPSRVICLQ
ncbi:hypothetical protein ABIA55_000882 [Pseudomonas frederiksbergensis]